MILVSVGKYTGNGTAKLITGVGFEPDITLVFRSTRSVMIKGSNFLWGLDSMEWDGLNITGGSGINQQEEDGFSVGGDANVNSNGEEYHYICLKATDGEIVETAYTGNGGTQTFTGLTDRPEMVWTLHRGAGTYAGLVKTKTMDTTESCQMGAATAFLTNGITGFTADGFSLGANTNGNDSGQAYSYFAFMKNPYIFYMNYPGEAAVDDYELIYYAGFNWLTIMRDGVSHKVMRTSTMVGDVTKEISNAPASDFQANQIQQLSPNVQLGSNNTTYGTTSIYHLFAFSSATLSSLKPPVILGNLHGNLTGGAGVDRSLTWMEESTFSFRTRFFADTLSSQNFFKIRPLTRTLWFGLFFNSVGSFAGNTVRTEDGGLTWDLPYAVPAANRVWQDIARASDGRLWGLTQESGTENHTEIWFSDDNGDTWTESFDDTTAGQRIYNLKCHPSDPTHIVAQGRDTAGTGVRTYVTTNRGSSWTINAVATLLEILSITHQRDIMLLETGRIVLPGYANGTTVATVYTSDDNGVSWVSRLSLAGTTLGAAEELLGPWGDPSTGEIFVYANDDAASPPKDNQVWRSADFASSFSQIIGVTPGNNPVGDDTTDHAHGGCAFDPATGYFYFYGLGRDNTSNKWQIQRIKYPWTTLENVTDSLIPLTEGALADGISGNYDHTSTGIAVLPEFSPSNNAPVGEFIIQPVGANALDTWIHSTDATARHGLEQTLKFGNLSGEKKAILEFPLRGLRAGSLVSSSSQLVLSTITAPGGAGFTGRCKRITRTAWDQVTATYNQFREGSNWSTAGGDVAANTPLAFTFTVPSGGDLTIAGKDLAAFVQDALDNRADRLIILLEYASGSSLDIEVASGQYPDVSKAPKLILDVNDSGLGYFYPDGKRSLAGCAVSSEDSCQEQHGRFLAVGKGSNAALDWESRRRLKEEIYRVPVIGSTIEPTILESNFWGYLGPGQVGDEITEIALMAGDTTKLIDPCESITSPKTWSATGTGAGSPILSTDRKEGRFSVEAAWSSASGLATLAATGRAVDLSSFNLDDYLCFWHYLSSTVNILSLSVQITDDQGAWVWTVTEGIVAGWKNWMLRLGDYSSFTPSSTVTTPQGPTVMSAFGTAVFRSSVAVTQRIDHVRMIKANEEILAWAPTNLLKNIADSKKIFMNLTSKRGTN